MRIHRAVNNNIVIVLDENGQERILMGKGIGYRRHSGDEFDESLVDKEFRLAASEQTERPGGEGPGYPGQVQGGHRRSDHGQYEPLRQGACHPRLDDRLGGL